MTSIKRAFGNLTALGRQAIAGLKGSGLSGDRLKRLGYYAALALLLVLLGSASYAYRNRGKTAEVSPTPAPRAALSVQLPAVTPAPTPEPVLWERPLEGETVGAYSPGEPIWNSTLGQWQTHPALDIAGSPGEAVCACRDGVVSDAFSDRLWGNVIVIDHEDGYQSTYAGLNTLEMVKAGDSVQAGQVIASVGSSAACEADLGWHLHFELTRAGEPADFEALIQGRN